MRVCRAETTSIHTYTYSTLLSIRVTCPGNIPLYLSAGYVWMPRTVLIEWGLWEGAAWTAQHVSPLTPLLFDSLDGLSPSGQQPPI